ncbi:MAG: dihydropteroate synthase [Bacteroidales bacterium]|nr:dihydropteroate synthase [Bacteroidales bacterium]
MTTEPAFEPFSITVGGRLVEFRRPAVMGILNITPDSFYDGGRHLAPADMLAHAHRLLDDGADIIDLGAASSRPGATLPHPDEEAARLTEAIRLLRTELPDAILSVDTCWATPARAAIEAGADIINDISGGQFDEEMFPTVASLQIPYLMMHTRGLPGEMQQLAGYDDIIDDLTKYFSTRLDTLYRLGVKDIWLDPGFGFAKSLDDNYILLDRLSELTTLFRQPLVAALSRKSMIYKRLGCTPDDALHGTVALDAIALLKGARILRVHDPRPALDTIKLLFP